jgi:hypothetical protein
VLYQKPELDRIVVDLLAVILMNEKKMSVEHVSVEEVLG